MIQYLSGTQLKAGRSILNLGVRNIGELIGASRTTISKLENGIIHLKNLRLSSRRNAILVKFFKSNNIIFPDPSTIVFLPQADIPITKDGNTLTRFQFKAARTILNDTHLTLSKYLNLSTSTISYAELRRNEEYITLRDELAIQKFLEKCQKHHINFPNKFSVFFQEIS